MCGGRSWFFRRNHQLVPLRFNLLVDTRLKSTCLFEQRPESKLPEQLKICGIVQVKEIGMPNPARIQRAFLGILKEDYYPIYIGRQETLF